MYLWIADSVYWFLLAAAVIYMAFIFPTQWLKIERVQRNMNLGIRIMQLSDLHVERLRISPARLARLLAEERPDYLFITGDFTKRRSYLGKLEKYLHVFLASGVPVYAVLGNHDYQQREVDELIQLLQSYGIRILRNESLTLERFELVGIDDNDSGKSDPALAYQDVDRSRPVLVITHDPNIVLQLEEPYDYLMAGHLHGKQFNLPYFFHLKDAGPLPRMGIYQGLHRSASGTYYISKGMGQTGINARFMVRSEVTIHDL